MDFFISRYYFVMVYNSNRNVDQFFCYLSRKVSRQKRCFIFLGQVGRIVINYCIYNWVHSRVASHQQIYYHFRGSFVFLLLYSCSIIWRKMVNGKLSLGECLDLISNFSLEDSFEICVQLFIIIIFVCSNIMFSIVFPFYPFEKINT